MYSGEGVLLKQPLRGVAARAQRGGGSGLRVGKQVGCRGKDEKRTYESWGGRRTREGQRKRVWWKGEDKGKRERDECKEADRGNEEER